VAKLVQQCARSGGTVLDLGGGAILSAELHLRSLEVVTAAPAGIPVSSFFKEAGVPVVQNRLPEACFQPGVFDVIVSNHVLEHQRDPRVAIHAMLDMLASGGSIVIQVPDANSWQALLLAGAWAGFDIPRHPVIFDNASLERCLESCGLSVATRNPCSNIEAAFCLATSVCPWLDPDLRQLRGVQEHPIVEGLKDACYCLLSVGVFPLVLLEYASGSGPAVLVEARRTADLARSSNDQQDDREPHQSPSEVAPEEERPH
jgi:SAM-dependent methyltransferase